MNMTLFYSIILDMTLLYLLIFSIIMFLVYFDYMLGVVRVIIMFMHRIVKPSFLLTNRVSGRHCVSVVLIRCLPADAPYIPDRMVDHEGDSLVESFVVHLPSVSQVGPGCDGSSQALFLLFFSNVRYV